MFRRLFICLLALIPVMGFAKKTKGDALDFLKGEKALHVIIDISQAQMMGSDNDGESMLIPLWQEDSTVLAKRFYYGVRDELEKAFFLVGNHPEANYKVIMHIRQVASDGTVYSTMDFMPINGDTILASLDMVGDGGRIGTFLSLFGDGLEHTGEDFGKILKKHIKKK